MKTIEVDASKMVALLLDQPWHSECDIVKKDGKRDGVFVVHKKDSEYPAYLRFSCGPSQGYFWDIYGDNMIDTELAVLALSKAPYPRNVAPVVYHIPIKVKS